MHPIASMGVQAHFGQCVSDKREYAALISGWHMRWKLATRRAAETAQLPAGRVFYFVSQEDGA